MLSSSENETTESSNVIILEDYFTPKQPSNKTKKRKVRKFMRPKKIGVFLSFFNLINDVLSPGTLGMCQMTAQAGIFTSCVFTIFFAMVTLFTLCVLYELSRGHLKTSLVDLSQKAFGKVGVVLTIIPIMVFNYGGALGMFIMFGHIVPDLMSYLLRDFNGSTVFTFFTSRPAILSILSLVMIPFAMRREMGSYAITSLLSVLSVLLTSVWLLCEKLFNVRYIPPPNDAMDLVRSQPWVHWPSSTSAMTWSSTL